MQDCFSKLSIDTSEIILSSESVYDIIIVFNRLQEIGKEQINMQKATRKTKLLTALLTLCMVLSLAPISAFAADLTVSTESGT